MSLFKVVPQPETPQPEVIKFPPCRCGCARFREASRISQTGGPDSVMFECVKCGEYRL